MWKKAIIVPASKKPKPNADRPSEVYTKACCSESIVSLCSKNRFSVINTKLSVKTSKPSLKNAKYFLSEPAAWNLARSVKTQGASANHLKCAKF